MEQYIQRLINYGYDYSSAVDIWYRHCESSTLLELEVFLREIENEV